MLPAPLALRRLWVRLMTRPLLIAAAVAAYCALLWLYADTHADIIAALTLATVAGLCALVLHPALYPSHATDTGDPT